VNHPNFDIRTLTQHPNLFMAIRREDGKAFGPAEAPAMVAAMNASDRGIDMRARVRETLDFVAGTNVARQREKPCDAQRRRIRESEARQKHAAFMKLWKLAVPI
jgi:hypothetical protein